MAHKQYRWRISLTEAEHSVSSFSKNLIVPIFDMIRYDDARVIEVDASSITLQSAHPPTTMRYASFGIGITILQ